MARLPIVSPPSAPPQGLTETITDPLVDLSGHMRKVTLLRFHPCASNVLASISADLTVKLWDIEKGSECFSLDGVHTELIQDIQWSPEGKVYVTTSKDKTVRITDPRENTVAISIPQAHEGAKSVKTTFIGSQDKLVTVGFTRQSQRQIKIWDTRNPAAPLTTEKIDQAAGVIIPYYDEDTKVLYLAGKGDGNVRCVERGRRKGGVLWPRLTFGRAWSSPPSWLSPHHTHTPTHHPNLRYYEMLDDKPFCFKLSEYVGEL